MKLFKTLNKIKLDEDTQAKTLDTY